MQEGTDERRFNETVENRMCPHLAIHHPQQGRSHPLYRFNEIGRTLGLAPCDRHEGRCHPLVGKGCRTTSLTVIQNARTSK